MELTKLTFAMIKPDAVEAHNAGKIIDMIEQNGFEILRMQKVIIAQDLAEEFYAEHKGKSFCDELMQFVTSGPVIILALYKDNAIVGWRELIGATDPAKAAVGTIRYLYGTSIGNNAVHGSADSASATNELQLFFPELFEYESGDENCSKDECPEDDECCQQ